MDVPRYYKDSDTVLRLVQHTQNDAWLVLKLMFKLAVRRRKLALEGAGQHTLTLAPTCRVAGDAAHEANHQPVREPVGPVA